MGKRLIVSGLVISLMLGVGSIIMNQICNINENTIKDQSWLDTSRDICNIFVYLSDVIRSF